MDDLNVRKAGKIALIEGQHPFDSVDMHCRHQSRVVHLNS